MYKRQVGVWSVGVEVVGLAPGVADVAARVLAVALAAHDLSLIHISEPTRPY